LNLAGRRVARERECLRLFAVAEPLGHGPLGWARLESGGSPEITSVCNLRLNLAACGRRLRRNAQWKPFILSAAPAGRSLCAIR
jgi:hypothetical protein